MHDAGNSTWVGVSGGVGQNIREFHCACRVVTLFRVCCDEQL